MKFLPFYILSFFAWMPIHRIYSQSSPLSVSLKFSPKLSFSQTNGINATRGWSTGESDNRFALSGGWDANISIGYSINDKNTISAGFGFFQTNQNFKNWRFVFLEDFKKLRKTYIFYEIPLRYERKIWNNSKWDVTVGVSASMIFEPFQTFTDSTSIYEEPVFHKNGTKVDNVTAVYFANVAYFGILYSASANLKYHIDNHISIISGIEFKQGLKQISRGLCHFYEYDDLGRVALKSFEINTSNGQSVLWNLGITYRF